MYIFAFLPSTTVILPSISISASFSTASIALATSDNFPTPDGSMITRSGWYSSNTFTSALLKSPTSVQQIHPEFISVISIPASFKNPPSIPISPNSFSISTSFSPAHTSLRSFLINVVFPAPRNPEIMSTFVMFTASFLSIFKINKSPDKYIITNRWWLPVPQFLYFSQLFINLISSHIFSASRVYLAPSIFIHSTISCSFIC